MNGKAITNIGAGVMVIGVIVLVCGSGLGGVLLVGGILVAAVGRMAQ